MTPPTTMVCITVQMTRAIGLTAALSQGLDVGPAPLVDTSRARSSDIRRMSGEEAQAGASTKGSLNGMGVGLAVDESHEPVDCCAATDVLDVTGLASFDVVDVDVEQEGNGMF
jgi:hypothetical protein